MERQSSYGSGSSAGSAFTATTKVVKDAEKDQVLETGNQPLLTALFGALFTLAKEKINDSAKIAIFAILVDFLLITLLFLMPEYPWAADPDSWIFKVFFYIEFHLPIAYAGYTFYLVVFYILVVTLFISVGICIWVGWCFKNDSFPFLWPIKVARVVVSVFVSMFYIASLNIFLIACQCSKHDGHWTHMIWGLDCLAPPHIIHAIFSLVSAVVFFLLALLLVIGDHELEPMSRSLLASPSSMCELRALLCKTIITTADILLREVPHVQVVVYCVCCGLIFYYHVRWAPHYTAWVNCFRGGLNAIMAWVSLMVCVLTYSVKWYHDDHGHPYWKQWKIRYALTIVMAIGVPVSFLLGAAACYLRLLHAWRCGMKFVRYQPGMKARSIHRFTEDFDVEVAARSLMRVWVDDEGTLDPVALDLAESVLKAGVAMKAKSPYLHIVYSNFLIEVRKNHQSGWSHLEEAKKLNLNLSFQFSIFTRQQESKQKSAAGSSGEASVDLVSYVEFQKNYKSLLVYHKAALVANRSFWRVLMKEQIPLERLSHSFQRIDEMEFLAEKTYKLVLERYPKSVKLLRSYGKFLEHVKNDPWGAARYYSEAEKQEEIAEIQATTATVGEGKVDDRNSAVITINGVGIIQTANKTAQQLLGYHKNELEGKNVSILMPAPFSQRHNTYLRNYATTEKAKILNVPREVVALHKERYVFPVSLIVTKISGSGADAIFMGLIKHVEPNPQLIKAWLTTTGTVLCVDQSFMDYAGWGPGELVGRALSSLGTDSEAIDQCIANTGRYSEAQLKSGAVRLKTTIQHKYSDPMPVDMKFEMGGSEDQRILLVTMVRTAEVPLMAAVDHRGRLVYVNTPLANALGHKLKVLKGKDITTIMPQPHGSLHLKYIREAEHSTNKKDAGCQSSMSQLLLSSNGTTIPMRMGINCHMEGSEIIWAMKFHRSSPAAMIDERRLQLRVNQMGVVVAASAGTPGTLFGLEPEKVLGMQVTELVDVFYDYSKTGGHMTAAMLALVQKSAAKPGTSWRVGVGTAVGQAPSESGAKDAATLRHALLHPKHADNKLRGAVMTVGLVDAVEEPVALIEGEGRAALVINLWRADVLMGVVELIPGPTVAKLDNNVGLMFGRFHRLMNNHHLYRFLAMSPKTTLDDLMGFSSQKKGGMKKANNTKVGPKKTFDAVHADGRPMQVSLQAVLKDGTSQSRLVALLQLQKPSRGAPGLLAALVAETSAKEAAKDVLSREGSEAALERTIRITSQPGALPEQPVVPGLALGGGPGLGGDGLACTARGSHGGDALATARGVDLELLATTRSSRGHVGFGGPPEEEQNAAAEHMDEEQLQLHAQLTNKRQSFSRLDLKLSDDDEEPVEQKPTKPARKKHLTEEEKEAELNKKGADKAKEWLDGNFAFKNYAEPDETTDFALPGAVWDGDDEKDGGGSDGPAAGAGALVGQPDTAPGGGAGTEVTSGSGADPAGLVNDFSRGKRLKKLLRLLNSRAAQQAVLLFKYRMLFLVLGLIVLHVVCFAVVLVVLKHTHIVLTELRAAGLVSDNLLRMCSLGLVLEAAQRGVGFTPENLPVYAKQLEALSDDLEYLHKGTYLGFGGLRPLRDPALFGLWHDPAINMTEFLNAEQPGGGTAAVDSLFNLGMRFLVAAREVAYWAVNSPDSLTQDRNWWFVIENGPKALYRSYLYSLNLQVLGGQGTISVLRLTILAVMVVEGFVVCLLVTGYVLYLLRALTQHRKALFTVFLAIPNGYLRNLASKSVNIEDEESEDEGEAWNKKSTKLKEDGNDAEGAKDQSGHGEVTVKLAPQVSSTGANPARKEKRGVSLMGSAEWGNSGNGTKSTKATKGNLFNGKTLVNSAKDAYRLTWPFLVYGALLVGLYVNDFRDFGNLNAVLVYTKLGQRVLAQSSRVCYLMDHIVLQADDAERPVLQLQLRQEGQLLKDLYSTLLYGGGTLSDAAKDGSKDDTIGALFKEEPHAVYLFTGKTCHREGGVGCVAPDDRYYSVSVNAIDPMMQRLLKEAELMSWDDPAMITHASQRYTYQWNIARNDLHSAMMEMAVDFMTDAFGTISKHEVIHVALLLITLGGGLALLVLMVLPFLKAISKESKRVAELLAQLPAEMDVEGIVESSFGAAVQDDLLKQAQSRAGGWLGNAWRSVTGAPLKGSNSGSNMPLVPGPYTSSWEGAAPRRKGSNSGRVGGELPFAGYKGSANGGRSSGAGMRGSMGGAGGVGAVGEGGYGPYMGSSGGGPRGMPALSGGGEGVRHRSSQGGRGRVMPNGV